MKGDGTTQATATTQVAGEPKPDPPWTGLGHKMATPRWEDLRLTDGRGFTDPDLLPLVEYVFVDDVCGLDVRYSRWIKWSQGHTHFIPFREPEICIGRASGAVTPSGLYTVCLLHEYAHVVTQGAAHGDEWEQVCWQMGKRVGRHAARHRQMLEAGEILSAEDFEKGWSGRT